MKPRKAVNRLELGPIVGHTDHVSTRIWIRVRDEPSSYLLRINRHGVFPFQGTEGGAPEFGTALAVAEGLRSDWRYEYQVIRRGRVVPGGFGSFRTMPDPMSLTDVLFVAISCSAQDDEGAWSALLQYIERSQPRFLLLMGDQVYVDSDPSVWVEHFESKPAARRVAVAEKYQQSWSRDVVQRVLANIPSYMMWDDHEIRDGWGSFAPDSPTLSQLHPRGLPIFQKHDAYFEDARDVYWHFQACRNPLPAHVQQPPVHGQRQALPFFFRCGRTGLLVLDSRGDRDLWRPQDPVLGSEQWQYLDDVLENLSPDVDALVVVTPVPIASMSPDGQSQFLLGRRTDDVELFKRGDAKGLRSLESEESLPQLGGAAVGGWFADTFGTSANVGSFKVASIDDVRDQWSHHLSRPEQERLVHKALAAAVHNRIPALPRSLLFLGGDLHAGALFDLAPSEAATVPCLVSSGISQRAERSLLIGTLLDEEFEVASGVQATLRQVAADYNFGVVHVVPTGGTPVMIPSLWYSGESRAEGVKVKVFV